MTPSRDAAYCEHVARKHARTFTRASRYLPMEKRRAAYAVYAFCRVVDDAVDAPDAGGEAEIGAELDAYDARLTAALGGNAEGPIFRELAWTAERFAVPAAPLRALIAGVRRDVGGVPLETWLELEGYCEGVASTVGVVCAHIFGLPDEAAARERALAHSRTLGIAMQLTNILRDVGEDAAGGRCYLPTEDLEAFGLRREEVLGRTVHATDDRWRWLMAFEIARARTLYAAAAPGIAFLAADAQGCARMCATGYAGILGAIEEIGYDSLTRRARVGQSARAAILWDVWRSSRRPLAAPPRCAPDPRRQRDVLPRVGWLGELSRSLAPGGASAPAASD
ncbi:MAG: phytoene/squalene synthase family protein [Gemmatimonadaceae bacterium]